MTNISPDNIRSKSPDKTPSVSTLRATIIGFATLVSAATMQSKAGVAQEHNTPQTIPQQVDIPVIKDFADIKQNAFDVKDCGVMNVEFDCFLLTKLSQETINGKNMVELITRFGDYGNTPNNIKNKQSTIAQIRRTMQYLLGVKQVPIIREGIYSVDTSTSLQNYIDNNIIGLVYPGYTYNEERNKNMPLVNVNDKKAYSLVVELDYDLHEVYMRRVEDDTSVTLKDNEKYQISHHLSSAINRDVNGKGENRQLKDSRENQITLAQANETLQKKEVGQAATIKQQNETIKQLNDFINNKKTGLAARETNVTTREDNATIREDNATTRENNATTRENNVARIEEEQIKIRAALEKISKDLGIKSDELQKVEEEQIAKATELQKVEEEQIAKATELQKVEEKQIAKATELQKVEEEQTAKATELQKVEEKQIAKATELQKVEEEQATTAKNQAATTAKLGEINKIKAELIKTRKDYNDYVRKFGGFVAQLEK